MPLNLTDTLVLAETYWSCRQRLELCLQAKKRRDGLLIHPRQGILDAMRYDAIDDRICHLADAIGELEYRLDGQVLTYLRAMATVMGVGFYDWQQAEPAIAQAIAAIMRLDPTCVRGPALDAPLIALMESGFKSAIVGAAMETLLGGRPV